MTGILLLEITHITSIILNQTLITPGKDILQNRNGNWKAVLRLG